jgi:hypothetical protein
VDSAWDIGEIAYYALWHAVSCLYTIYLLWHIIPLNILSPAIWTFYFLLIYILPALISCLLFTCVPSCHHCGCSWVG